MFLHPGLSFIYPGNCDLLELPVCHEWHIHRFWPDRSVSILCPPGRSDRDPWSHPGPAIGKMEGLGALPGLPSRSHGTPSSLRRGLRTATDGGAGSLLVEKLSCPARFCPSPNTFDRGRGTFRVFDPWVLSRVCHAAGTVPN